MPVQPQRPREVQEIGDVIIVRWDEQPQWPAMADELFTLAQGSGRRKLLLNFANVDTLSSMMLAKLMSLHKKLQTAGGMLALCNVSPQVRQVFEITRVSEFFGFHPGEQEALQALTASAGPAVPGR